MKLLVFVLSIILVGCYSQPHKGHWTSKRLPMRYVWDGGDEVCGSVEEFEPSDYLAKGPDMYKHYVTLNSAIAAVEQDCQ